MGRFRLALGRQEPRPFKRPARAPARMTAAVPSDDDIRKMAKARVGFRQHVASYVIINLFLAGVWWFTSGRDGDGSYWPIWVHLGWGLGLAFNWWGVYGGGQDAVAREEERLRQKFGRA